MLTLYPNPATSHIIFGLSDGEGINAPYKVVDASGRTVLQGELVPMAINRYSIDVTKLAPGSYIVSIMTKKGSTQASFLKR
jgi:hypothetical protein